MIIYLCRHAHAQNSATNTNIHDSQRELTRHGEAIAVEAANALKSLHCKIDAVLSSPYRRAQQTAQIIKDARYSHSPMSCTEHLSPGAPFSKLLNVLTSYNQDLSLLLVGHMPDLAAIAGMFLIGDTLLNINFKKSSIAKIVFNSVPKAGTGRLDWVITPAIISKMKS